MIIKLKDLNRWHLFLVIIAMELAELVDLEKVAKKSGFFLPIVVYVTLLIYTKRFSFLLWIILALILSAKFIIVRDKLKAKIGEVRGVKLAKKMRKWNAKELLQQVLWIFLMVFNLIIALIFSLQYTYILWNEQQPYLLIVLVILDILIGFFIIYHFLVNVHYWKGIREMVVIIRKKKPI